MKKITAIVLAVMMVFALCACGGGDNLTFVTGGEQGTYYAFGTVIAQQVSDKTNTAITAVPATAPRPMSRTLHPAALSWHSASPML